MSCRCSKLNVFQLACLRWKLNRNMKPAKIFLRSRPRHTLILLLLQVIFPDCQSYTAELTRQGSEQTGTLKMRCQVSPHNTNMDMVLWRGPHFNMIYAYHRNFEYTGPSIDYLNRNVFIETNVSAGYQIMSLPEVLHSDEGDYTCEVFDDKSGYAISNPMSFKLKFSEDTLNHTLEIKDEVGNTISSAGSGKPGKCHLNSVCNGHALHLVCNVNYARPASEIQWKIEPHTNATSRETQIQHGFISTHSNFRTLNRMIPYQNITDTITISHLTSATKIECVLQDSHIRNPKYKSKACVEMEPCHTTTDAPPEPGSPPISFIVSTSSIAVLILCVVLLPILLRKRICKLPSRCFCVKNNASSNVDQAEKYTVERNEFLSHAKPDKSDQREDIKSDCASDNLDEGYVTLGWSDGAALMEMKSTYETPQQQTTLSDAQIGQGRDSDTEIDTLMTV